MVTSEKLTWIQQNLRRGDKKTISEKANADYSVVIDILKGKLWGEHGELVVAVAEKLIIRRIKKENREREKYTKQTA